MSCFYVVTPNFHNQVREYLTHAAIEDINAEAPMMETALYIAQAAIREYSNTDPGLPYTALTDDIQWARLSAMQHCAVMHLHQEFWPDWPNNPLETCADALSRNIVEHGYSMIRWDTVAQHYLHLSLTEIALLALSDDSDGYDTASAVVETIHVETPASPEDSPPEPAMSFWV